MNLHRRGFLGSAAFASIVSAFRLPRLALGDARRRDVYAELGIRPVLNFRGTHTVVGASKEWPELHEAMAQASRQFVMLEELHDAVGERIAGLMGTEAAMVTTGAAGAITLGTCAALTGDDGGTIRRLPDLTGMKSEVIIQKVHRNGYDHAVRATGVRIVEVETRAQLEAAASERTAMLYFLGGSSGDWAYETPISLEECIAVGRKAGFPVLVDSANMLPPWENLRKLAAAGTDLIASSGGKHMRGPQCGGILAGRRDLIRAARLNSNPHSDSLGRGLKVGREEMIGVWLAAQKYSRLDFAAVDRQCQAQAEYLKRELEKIPGLQVASTPHDRTRRVHRLTVQWDEKALGLTASECDRRLLEGEPRVAVLRNQPQGLLITVFMNDPGDERAAARRFKEVFSSAARSTVTGGRS